MKKKRHLTFRIQKTKTEEKEEIESTSHAADQKDSTETVTTAATSVTGLETAGLMRTTPINDQHGRRSRQET